MPLQCAAQDPLRLVLDTNVWLDWLVFNDASIASVQDAVRHNAAVIYISTACEAELRRVLAYPLTRFTLDATQQAAALAQCRSIAHGDFSDIEPHHLPRLPRCSDPDDQMFLELARDCRADVLLTKDRALLAIATRKQTRVPFRILTPLAFSQANPSVKL